MTSKESSAYNAYISLERIQGYIDIEHEPSKTESGVPPAAWPTSGDIRVEKLSARYSQVRGEWVLAYPLLTDLQTGPRVLHEISFHIKSGERVGIVGRTGSGKVCLLRLLLHNNSDRHSELIDSCSSEVYPNRGLGLLRWCCDQHSQLGCPQIEYHDHSTDSKSPASFLTIPFLIAPSSPS